MDSGAGVPSPQVWISRLTFSDGTAISLDKSDIVLLVGPNNSGKSVALREILIKAQAENAPALVVDSLGLEAEGGIGALCDWLNRTSLKTEPSPNVRVYSRMGTTVSESNAKHWWQQQTTGLHDLARFFVCLLNTEDRLRAANPAPNIAILSEPLSHPIHYMQRDEVVERKISSHFKAAFGEDIIVHRNAGKEVPLYCGSRPNPACGEDRISTSYLAKLEKLPMLHTQGDGMRAFVGVILHLFALDYSVVLVDEPDAFLHPPQARRLGQIIMREAPRRRQLFLATHSGDFLRGLLDMETGRVRVLRISRDGGVNAVRELDSQGIRNVWNDPILRYSNVLDGLFHARVVLCESDSDCRFYAATMDAVLEASGRPDREDVMFIHCSGKDRMPTVMRSLKKLDVPVTVICDFDILRSEHPIRDIVEALGGQWSAVAGHWQTVHQAIASRKPDLSTDEIVREITGVLEGVKEARFPDGAKDKIRIILRKSSPWATAKSTGRAYIPSGEPTTAFETMCERLEALGLFIVPVGEMEGFARSIGGHGPKWVNEVLESRLIHGPKLAEARDFIQRIVQGGRNGSVLRDC